MKTLLHFSAILLATAGITFGQGIYYIDQSSSSSTSPQGGGVNIQGKSPIGQSFTPTNSSINFIQLGLNDGNFGDGLGASVVVDLHSNSITGPVLGSTTPISMPSGFQGGRDLFFPSPVALTPGMIYYFDLRVLSGGGSWNVDAYTYPYNRGIMFTSAVPVPNNNLWFHEGVYIVPKPSKPIRNPDGSVTIPFSGFHGTTNITQSTTNLSPPIVWQNAATNVADANGLWQFTGPFTNAPARFYRGYTVAP